MSALRHRVLGTVVVGFLATLVLWGVAEVLLRVAYRVRAAMTDAVVLPYDLGDDYGPRPPWTASAQLLEPDPALLWRSRPGVQRRYVDVFSPVHAEDDRIALYRRFWPRVPASLRSNPTWEIALNAHGFRAHEFDTRKPPGRVRVVCLGDSWTFGANVGQPDAYPQRLQALLRAARPGADIEVLNLGVLGYSSFQGVELLKRLALALEPDVVLIGFGMNDSSVAGYRDADLGAAREVPPRRSRLAAVLGRSEVFRVLAYAALAVRHRPRSTGDHLRAAGAAGASRASPVAEYAGVEQWTRVPLADYERNLHAMIALAHERGAGVVLLFNEVWEENPYRAAARRVAGAARVPFVDAAAIVGEARRRTAVDLERTLGLDTPPPPADAGSDVELVFRVHANGYPVPKALYIAGTHPSLGDVTPNRVALYDDGTHGDQRAGDGVWSYAARIAPGTNVAYVYTNSGREGRWEGLDVPARRMVRADGPAGRRVHLPIESFGKLHMQADTWHTDARGYDLIARAALDVLVGDERLAGRVVARR